MREPGSETIQSDKDAIAAGTTEAELWLKKIDRARLEEKEWREDATEAVEAYEATDSKTPISFNLFHSNIETLIPALYNSSPVPDVRRRFGDADKIGKQVVDLCERAISYSIDNYDVDSEFIAMIRDAAVTGRGVMRIRYEPHENGYQETYSERVPWDKFIRGPARSWSKVPWVAFEHNLTKDELAKLNPALAKKTPIGDTSELGKDDISKDPTGVLATLPVYEIWDKAKRELLFVDDQKRMWRRYPDVLKLPEFFPVMPPLQPVRRPSSMIPVCQYKIYKPLLDELDAVTKRISKLVKQLKVRGLIDGEMAPDFEQLRNCNDGEYISASNAATFASQGGLEKAIAHWPMDPIVKALQQLYLQRDAIKQTIYEVTGISDILRGATNANETATAQNIKNQWGSLRIQGLQAEVARVGRDLFRMMVAVFAAHYDEENIRMMTGMPVAAEPQAMPAQMPGQPPMQPQPSEAEQQWPEVFQAFKSEGRSYRIDIETDSTIRADMTRNQEQMNNFLAGTGQFAQAMATIIQLPEIGQASMPVMVEIYTAFARKFKLGKQAEDALDKLSQTTQQAAQMPQEERPDPEAEKAKMEMQAAQQRTQLDQQSMQAKAAMEQQSMQAKAQADARMMELAERKAMLEIQMKEAELQIKREEIAMKREDMVLSAQIKAADRAQDFQMGQMERRESAAMMHETNDAKRQSMADKARFDAQKRKQQNRPSA